MTLLPIVERELRVRARQKATFWVRFGAALVGVLICFMEMLRFAFVLDPAVIGSALFNSLALTAYLVSCLAFLLTADVISSERREKTLGLLFLTRIKGLDVLIGKTVSSSLMAVSALAGYLPILMLPVLLGGVTGGEAARKGFVIATQLLSGIAAGVWASSRGADWFASTARALGVSVVLISLSAAALNLADGVAFASNQQTFWLLMSLQHLAIWWLLLGAWQQLRDSLQAGEHEHASKPAIIKPRTLPVRRRREPLADDMNPIEWCVRHERGVRSAFWVAAVLLFVCHAINLARPLMGGFRMSSSWLWSWWVIQLAFGLFAAALQAWAATRFFMETRHTGELEVLLSTPLGAGAVITGQWRALRRHLRGPVLFSLAPIILHAAIALGSVVIGWRDERTWPGFWMDLERIAAAWFNVVAVCWVGLWFALKASRPAAAVARTVILVLGIPLGFSLFLSVLFAFLPGVMASPSPLGFSTPVLGFALSTLMFLMFWLSILWPVLLVFWARRRLQTDLRGIARVRFGVRSDWSEVREAWNRRRQNAAVTIRPSPVAAWNG